MSTDSIVQPPRGKLLAKNKGVITPAKNDAAEALSKPKNLPLSIHKGTGYWCKKVRGKVHYFGKVSDDPKGKAAMEQWLEVKDDLLAGREPRAKTEGLTVAGLANEFLAHKETLRDNGELSPRTFRGLYDTCATVVKVFGRNRVVNDLAPVDFGKLRDHLSKTRAAVALRNEMQRVRSLFKFGFDQFLIATPMRFGQSFAKPKLDVVRREREQHRSQHGDKMFEAADVRALLDGTTVPDDDGNKTTVPGASHPLKAMILLAANCGFGQTDLSALPTRAISFDSGWIDFARVKTAVRRRIPLWPETIAAIQEWLTVRPKAKDPADAGLLFLTCRGSRWVKLSETGSPCDAIGQEFNKLLIAMKLKRLGVSFYALRHGFETIAGETTDQVAVDAIMGHVPQGMSAHYRERIGENRLRRVVEHVRAWLFGAVSSPCSPEEEALEIAVK